MTRAIVHIAIVATIVYSLILAIAYARTHPLPAPIEREPAIYL